MSFKLIIVLSALTISCLAQRSPYAKRPIGYPYMTPSTTTTTTGADELGNRFGDDDQTTTTTTTERLPIEALGDRDLINRLSKLPVDNQPFWYINWKALEEFRKNPQTYPQKENSFINNHGR